MAENPTNDNTPKQTIASRASARDRLLQKDITTTTPEPVVPIEKPKTAPKAPTQKTKKRANKKSAIRTYYDDVTGFVQDKKMSMTDIVLAEQKQAQAQKAVEGIEEEAPQPRRVLPILALVAALVLLVGGGGVLLWSILATEETGPVMLQQEAERIVRVDGREPIVIGELRSRDLKEKLTRVFSETTTTPEKVIETPFVLSDGVTTVPINNFIEQLTTSIDQGLARSLTPTYLAGLYGEENGSSTPFLILTTNFFENAFAGMLRWEGSLLRDLSPFAHTPATPVLPESEPLPVATTTQATTTPEVEAEQATTTTAEGVVRQQPQERIEAQDIIIANNDARALVDQNGIIRMIYAFPDDETIIITNTAEALQVLLGRYREVRFQ